MWWHTVTRGRGSEGWNWRMEWVANILHTTSEHGVSSITTADAHTSAASSRLNWCPCRFKWARPFRRKTKSGFRACVITFQLASTPYIYNNWYLLFFFVDCFPGCVGKFQPIQENSQLKMHNTYQLLYIYSLPPWWWATNMSETCRGWLTK